MDAWSAGVKHLDRAAEGLRPMRAGAMAISSACQKDKPELFLKKFPLTISESATKMEQIAISTGVIVSASEASLFSRGSSPLGQIVFGDSFIQCLG